MIPLEKKKVKYFARKSNTICEKRRKNKALVKYVLQKLPRLACVRPFCARYGAATDTKRIYCTSMASKYFRIAYFLSASAKPKAT